METDDTFINTLRQFSARRGTPKEIRTDCGSNFRGADLELKSAAKAWSEKNLKQRLSDRGINWTFHPPNAPHFSEVWERLIKTIKRPLKAILKGALVKEHVLRTVFYEVESILNSQRYDLESKKMEASSNPFKSFLVSMDSRIFDNITFTSEMDEASA